MNPVLPDRFKPYMLASILVSGPYSYFMKSVSVQAMSLFTRFFFSPVGLHLAFSKCTVLPFHSAAIGYWESELTFGVG